MTEEEEETIEHSILETIKTSLGVELDFPSFDTEILMGINTSLMALNQLGVGPEDGFIVTSSDECWEDFLDENIRIEAAKSYVVLNTRLIFDSPSSSFVIESIKKQLEEIAWRLVVQIESPVEG